MKPDNSWDSLSDEQKSISIDNSMIELLTPEELEAFSQAEESLKNAKAIQPALWEEVKGRDLTGWREQEGTEAAEILSQLDPETREFARLADPDELIEFAEAAGAQAAAYIVNQKFYRIAARRMQEK
jgi:hypothetical protein